MAEEDAMGRALARDARAVGRLALDTEFMGEGRYRTLLCLIQLAIPDRSGTDERLELIDPLAGDFGAGAEDLGSVLADPAIQIVVHAGRQDIALLRRRYSTSVRNVFDTQVAAGFAGLGAQCSYETLLAEILGVRVSKSASFTRWDARPLSAEQLAYAREDVVHLLALASELERRLSALERLSWAREECQALEQASDERDLDVIFERLPRIRTLNASARRVAREIVAWRERTAAAEDRPVPSVLADAALVEIARRGPSSRAELAQIRGAGAGNRPRRAEQLLEVIARARELPPDSAPPAQRVPPPRPEDAPLIALAEALVRARAREAGLAHELLATRADLQLLLAASRETRGDADVRTLRGWRRELVGAELLELLDGRLSLAVSGRELSIEARASAQPREEGS
ncbi:MAG: ribonuclease D [Actinobacteria bacterium]|nr:MAG: ribonuclease D [Actinomycetota bacterium]